MDAAINEALAGISGCTAIGYVDIGASQLIGLKLVDDLKLELTELLAPTVAELFQGGVASSLEAVWRPIRQSETADASFRELIIATDDTLQILLRGRKFPDYAALFVWRSMPNLGMALSKARSALPQLEMAFG
jgi:hypothetical protein